MDLPYPKRHHQSEGGSGHGDATSQTQDKDKHKDKELQKSTPFMLMFLRFRDELDEHHDRRERVIKASRDVTALSKKMIFSLQRLVSR
jgi:hypothetical protein